MYNHNIQLILFDNRLVHFYTKIVLKDFLRLL
jgi:hypothetical protein